MRGPALSVFMLCLAVGAFGQQSATDYLGFLPSDTRAALLSEGSAGDMGGTIDDLKLWQASPFAAALRSAYAARPSTIAAECWFLLDEPVAATEADRSLVFYKSFTSFSTMKGLLVYSESLKRMETFIYDSYRVASVADPQRLPDPSETETAVPGSATYTLYQKEEQTGNVYSEMQFISHGTWFEVNLTNLTPMKYLVFTLVRPRELQTTFYVIPAGDKVLLYGITAAKTPRFLGIEKLKRSSFFNRMKALASWFEANMKRQ